MNKVIKIQDLVRVLKLVIILIYIFYPFLDFSQSVDKRAEGTEDVLTLHEINNINYGVGNVSKPGLITGGTKVCPNTTGVQYSIRVVPGAINYTWTVPSDAVIFTGQGSTSISVNFGIVSGNVCVTAGNACGTSNPSCLAVTLIGPSAPTAGTNIATQTSITWKWNKVSEATGYKWNTTNTYNTAIDNGINTSYAQTGLVCGIAYKLYVWAYNDSIIYNSTPGQNGTCVSPYTTLVQTTTLCPTQCGTQVWTTTNLNVGSVVYATSGTQAMNTKWCWGDLPANCDTYGGLYQWATAMNISNTYMSTLANPVPILTTDEFCDPCSPTYGFGGVQGICPPGFHIPSDFEWSRYEYCVENNPGTYSLSYFQNGTTYLGANVAGYLKVTSSNSPTWDGSNTIGFSALPAGRYWLVSYLSLNTNAYFWTATETGTNTSWSRIIAPASTSGGIYRYNTNKKYGFSVRCIKDECNIPNAPFTGTNVYTGTQITWYWSSVSGASGYKWNTTADYNTATDIGTNNMYTQTGVSCNTNYSLYVWSYNNMCGNSAYTTLTQLNSPPTLVTASANLNPICTGTSLSLTETDAGGTSWAWSGPNGYTTPTQNPILSITGTVQGGVYTVTATNACGSTTASTFSVTVYAPPSVPSPGVNSSPIASQIMWNWNSVVGATGYKWNISSTYSSATDNGTSTSYLEMGLNCSTEDTLYVWSYNSCWNSSYITLTQITPACPQCGLQTWAAANQNIGTEVNWPTEQTTTLEKWCINNIPANCVTYGGVYEWTSAMNIAYTYNSNYTTYYGTTDESCNPCGPTTGKGGVRGICQSGYHIPSDYEWSQYEYCVENTPSGSIPISTFQNSVFPVGSTVGTKLKVTSSNTPSWNGTNASGFASLPAGMTYSTCGGTCYFGTQSYFWTSTEVGGYAPGAWSLIILSNQVERYQGYKLFGFSVRCLKD